MTASGVDAFVDPAPLDALDPRHLAAALRAPDRAESLPPWCYNSARILGAEIAKVFRPAWNCVGRSDRLPQPGDYSAFDLAGVPLILLRDRDGALRAFANSCRHRGTKLLQGDGTCRAVVCPFHSWSYALDGRLAAAPEMDRTPGFDRADHGLLPIRLETRDGFLFLCLDDRAEPLESWLGDFSALHAAWDLGDFVSARRRVIEVDCNWKLYLEVFNEYYHLKRVHAETIADVFHAPDPPEAATGNYLTQFGAHDVSSGLLEGQRDLTMPSLAAPAAGHRPGTRYTWLCPGTAFAVTDDVLWMHEVTPLDAARCRVAMTCCFRSSARELPDFEARAAAYYERLDVAIAEDIAVLELQQAGLDSPLARAGRFSWLEPNVAAFGAWFARRLTA